MPARMRGGGAPSASRTPISAVRLATEYQYAA